MRKPQTMRGLEDLGRVRLSENFFLRDFLHSEIASLYGMNFRLMPELDWKFGYPFALCLMVLSMVAPFWYFRRKGWLK